MRRIVGLVALVLVLAACAGTDWNSAQGPGGASRTAKSRGVTTRATAAERAYVDALTVSTVANENWTGISPATKRCIATAIVREYGTRGFDAAALGPNALRAPGASLDRLARPTFDQLSALGQMLQACHFGSSIAPQILAGFHDSSPTEAACLGRAIETDPRARHLLVLATIDRRPDAASARAFLAVLTRCVDLATVVVNLMNVHVDATMRSCLVDQLRGSKSDLIEYIAQYISGSDPELAQQAAGSIGVAVNRCRPSARTGFTIPSS